MEVCVWKYGREIRGWDGKQETYDKVLKFPVVDIATALYSVYKTDAHFCPAIIYEFDKPVSIQPRLNKISLEELEKTGKTVRFSVIAIDVDAPGKKATEEWRKEEKEKINASAICSNAIQYDTTGGYRLVWALEESVGVTVYEQILGQLRQTLKVDGIVADQLIDWTRCYRLPKVTRGGIAQDLYLLVPPSFVLREELLVKSKEKKESTPFDIIANATLQPGLEDIVEEGGRNNFLFKMASKIRGTAWIPEAMYFPMLQAINQEKCNPPLPESDIQTICNSVLRFPKGNKDDKEDAEDSGPKVKIAIRAGQLAETVNETIDALTNVTDNSLYHRDGRIVRLLENRIEEIPKASLRKLVADYIQFVRYNKDMEEVKQDPPMELIDIIYETGRFPQFRELHELLFLPSLTPEGALITQEGYNAELKAYIRPSIEIEEPLVGRKEAEEALGRIITMIDEFPFNKKEHLSVALAAIMTPVLRTAITGPTPMFLIDSTVPGTGKSKLADIASLIATGREAPRMVQTKEEEMEKRITAVLLSGDRTCLIDNIDKPLGGAALDALMTGDRWRGRILGKSEIRDIVIRTVLYATGNNIVLKGDMVRRALRCYMDPETERPEERVFRIKSHNEYISHNRSQLVRDIMTIALSYQNEERAELKTFGSFESWARWVREPLVWLGLPDPVITQKELREDSTLVNWSSVLEALAKIFGTGWFSVKDLYDVSFEGVRKNAEHEAYNALTANIAYFSEPGVKQLAWALKKWQGRIVGGKRLIRGDRDRLKGYLFRIDICQDTKESDKSESVLNVA